MKKVWDFLFNFKKYRREWVSDGESASPKEVIKGQGAREKLALISVFLLGALAGALITGMFKNDSRWHEALSPWWHTLLGLFLYPVGRYFDHLAKTNFPKYTLCLFSGYVLVLILSLF